MAEGESGYSVRSHDDNSLQVAVGKLKAAYEHDKNEDYRAALDLYKQGIQLLLIAVKGGAVPEKMRDAVRKKCDYYLTRIETLKRHIEKGSKPDEVSNNSAIDLAGNSIIPENEGACRIQQFITDCIINDRDVQWDDVAGLNTVKDLLKERVILPFKFPDLFRGSRASREGILIFGKPGSGKTYVMKACMAQLPEVTCFRVSACDLISRYMPECERTIKELFKVAYERKPSIIFIDDIEMLCAYSDRNNETQNIRRAIKTELFVQMSGADLREGVLIIAASPKPWTIDSCIRRRFAIRVYCSPPEKASRVQILKQNLRNVRHTLTDQNFEEVGEKTAGFTASDLVIVAREAMMMTVRSIQNASHFRKVQGQPSPDSTVMVDELLTPCSADVDGAIAMTFTDIAPDKLLEPDVTVRDMLAAVGGMKLPVPDEEDEQMRVFIEDFVF